MDCPGTPIVRMRFGSHLYGTATPASDTDWKGIYLPTREDILLGRIPKSVTRNTGNDHTKNAPTDVDSEWYSLHYFLKLASEGQTVAIDMLHAPDSWPEYASPIWEQLRIRRKMFHTKSLKAFVGYCRKQAAKYGVKGSRLSAVQSAIAAIDYYPPGGRLEAIWAMLPSGQEFIDKTTDEEGREFWAVCGRRLQRTASVGEALKSLRAFEANYGARAKMASENEGIDWKAISHAIRAAYEVMAILRTGDIVFPLPEAEFLRQVKLGTLDYKTEVGPMLEAAMEQCEAAAARSTLSEFVNHEAVDAWLLGVMQDYMR